MDIEKVKRGIDFNNRVLGGKLEERLQKSFSWWEGGKKDGFTIFLLVLVSAVNLVIIYPLIWLDVSPAFSSSEILLSIAALVEHILGITKADSFLFITLLSLSVAPLGIYLFVRRNVFNHEMTALLITLLFILPKPISTMNLPLYEGILSGDGSHIVGFSLIPFVLLFIQNFVGLGVVKDLVIAVFGISLIAILSPFAMFNLLIFILIITLSEGFLGDMRGKLLRTALMLVLGFATSLFWYLPNSIFEIVRLGHVTFLINRLLSILPFAIPAIPVFGTLAFLIFDRRERLKPLFLGLSMMMIYLFLYLISQSLSITGIFTAIRYVPELSFAISFLVGVITVPLLGLFFKKYVDGSALKFLITMIILLFIILGVGIRSFVYIRSIHSDIASTKIEKNSRPGIGGIDRVFNFKEPLYILVSSLSLATIVMLTFLLIRFPSNHLKSFKE